MDENMLWVVRAFVYQHFGETTRPPSVEKTASYFGLAQEQTAELYDELHRRHALFLQPKTLDILMAFPFSGVETPFRVHANDKIYFANCAWDSLGIPAALHTDARIEASCARSGEPVWLQVTGGQIQGADALVHFLVPFREWYDDLPFT